MTIKEIIISACELLAKDKVKQYVKGSLPVTDEVSNEVEKMTALCNLVINELAHTYIPMVKSEKVFSDGKVYYAKLSKTPIKILNVLDLKGNSLDFTFYHEFLVTNTSEVIIEYEYVPQTYGLEDTVDYTEMQVPSRVIAYGLISEILLSEYSFDQAVMWHKRYVDALEEIFIPKNAKVKKRSWL